MSSLPGLGLPEPGEIRGREAGLDVSRGPEPIHTPMPTVSRRLLCARSPTWLSVGQGDGQLNLPAASIWPPARGCRRAGGGLQPL